MKKAATGPSRRIHDIEEARSGSYILSRGKTRSKSSTRELLEKLDPEERSLASEVLQLFDSFYLRVPKNKYRSLENMWKNYENLSQKGKDIVRFGPKDASRYLMDFYSDRAEVDPAKYEFVESVFEKLNDTISKT